MVVGRGFSVGVGLGVELGWGVGVMVGFITSLLHATVSNPMHKSEIMNTRLINFILPIHRGISLCSIVRIAYDFISLNMV
jgi:ABC-type uncharacterized transport system permease subunit